jgi:hypothetical protein
MGKLHELLAVETDREKVFKNMVNEGINTFKKKADIFLGHHKRLEMRDDERKFEEDASEDHKALVSTVDEKLNFVAKSAITYFDSLYQKEKANQTALADLVMPDGTVLEKSMPATALLGLENRLKFLRSLYESVPTLSPGIEWEKDEMDRKGVWKTKHPETSAKIEKIVQHKIVAEATKEHPAQVTEWSDNVVVGKFITNRTSGMLTPLQKSEYLEKIDMLIQSAKKARQRANNVEVSKDQIGRKIFDFINS